MAEDLFGSHKELSRSDKMRKSRKVTTDLTREIINWLNDSQQFQVHRSNNFPSPRITRKKSNFKYYGILGDVATKSDFWAEYNFEYDDVDIHFKKGNVKESILDISGFVLPYNGNDLWAGKHIEIEVKTKKDTLSEGQIKRIADIKKAGGISFVFDSKETFRHQIKQYMVERKLAF